MSLRCGEGWRYWSRTKNSKYNIGSDREPFAQGLSIFWFVAIPLNYFLICSNHSGWKHSPDYSMPTRPHWNCKAASSVSRYWRQPVHYTVWNMRSRVSLGAQCGFGARPHWDCQAVAGLTAHWRQFKTPCKYFFIFPRFVTVILKLICFDYLCKCSLILRLWRLRRVVVT